jgi:hypothetical protein
MAALLALWLLARPDPVLTPGAVRALSHDAVCATRWGVDVRHVTRGMRRRVLAAYGVAWADRGQYVVDHLVPRELGGADTEANLWPQTPAEAYTKDRLEGALHRRVCAGEMALAFAQDVIRNDWQAAYRLYVPQVKK